MTRLRQARGGGARVGLLLLGIVAVLLGIGLGQLFFGSRTGPGPNAVHLAAGTLLPEPRSLDDFSLTTQDGQTLDRESLKGHWTFVAFGYTHCPDVCPTLLATFNALDKELAKADMGVQPEFLFVSVDPERDTPERIGKFVHFFSPRIRGATASHEVLRPLTTRLGVLYQRSDAQDSAMGYLVDHTASIFLLDPNVRLTAIFGLPHDPQAMAEDFRAISAQRETIP